MDPQTIKPNLHSIEYIEKYAFVSPYSCRIILVRVNPVLEAVYTSLTVPIRKWHIQNSSIGGADFIQYFDYCNSKWLCNLFNIPILCFERVPHSQLTWGLSIYWYVLTIYCEPWYL